MNSNNTLVIDILSKKEKGFGNQLLSYNVKDEYWTMNPFIGGLFYDIDNLPNSIEYLYITNFKESSTVELTNLPFTLKKIFIGNIWLSNSDGTRENSIKYRSLHNHDKQKIDDLIHKHIKVPYGCKVKHRSPLNKLNKQCQYIKFMICS